MAFFGRTVDRERGSVRNVGPGVLTLGRFSLLADTIHRFNFGDVVAGDRNFTCIVTHVHMQFAQLPGSLLGLGKQRANIGADADDEVVHRVANSVRSGGDRHNDVLH